METLPGNMTLELSEGSFPLSTDSMVLAHFARLPKQASVLDLGSGCGTIGLLLCSRNSECRITGVELTESAHQAALRNIKKNNLHCRMKSICSDFRTLQISPGSYDCCISNPPYFSGGPASHKTPLARRDDCCTPEELMAAAARAVRYGGDFFLVHKPEKLAQLIACGASQRMQTKRLRLIRHREDGPITFILLQLRKGAKPGVQIDEFSLYDSRNQTTDYYREVYHI